MTLRLIEAAKPPGSRVKWLYWLDVTVGAIVVGSDGSVVKKLEARPYGWEDRHYYVNDKETCSVVRYRAIRKPWHLAPVEEPTP